MRSIPFYPLLVLLLVGLGGYLGCDPNSITPPVNPVGNTASSLVQQTATIPQRTASTIVIGSFNLQRLGPSKLKEPAVIDALAQIIRLYDVIALQEITDSSGTAIQELLQVVNQGGAKYGLAESPRVGRPATGYFEQYAFLFDTARIAGSPDYCYMVQDQADMLHREPYVGRFRTLSNNPFSFTLINIHTDPDEVNSELDVLATVFTNVREFEHGQFGSDDLILLGDLNERPGRLRGLEQVPGLEPLITLPTNTRQNKTLDNFLLDRSFTAEFTGRAGTIDLQAAFQISLEDALKISDHQPIWAEFSAMSSGSAVTMSASLPGGFQR